MSVPRNHNDGVLKNRHGQALKDSLDAQKRAAATKNPYASRSDENVTRAKNWKDGSLSGQHTPRQ